MRILWISINASLYDENRGCGYCGGGWISALFCQFRGLKTKNIDLGIAFIYNKSIKETIDGVTYYGIESKKHNGLGKLLYYLGGYKRVSHLDYFKEITSVIEDFKPDLIHLWGIENSLASVSHYTDVPVVTHLQGFLSLYIYAYYPYGTNAYSFLLDRFSKREWFLHNGFIFGEHIMRRRAEIEKKHLRYVEAVMGRTSWDKDVAQFNNPNVKYYHVDEVLRKQFYSAPSWQKERNGKFIITSTISETVYKGFDVVLRAAAILKEYNYFDFEWQIIGVRPDSDFVKWFEKIVKVKCSEVNVRCLGVQTPESLIQSLLNADMYVHPSYIDNSPNSLCEAQYLGLPCCATNVGGVSSLIKDKVSGIMIPSNAPFDMAMAIKNCYDNEDIWREYSFNAKAAAQKRHNPERIIQQLISVYSDLTE